MTRMVGLLPSVQSSVLPKGVWRWLPIGRYLVSPNIHPPETQRFAFESDGFRYEVFRALLSHEDHDTLWLAWCRPGDAGARRLVVLKQVEVPEGRAGRTRALEEIRLAEHLRHPGIGRVLRLAERDGVPYVVMEHTRGAFLATLLGAAVLARRKLSPSLAAFITAEAAHALDFAHRCRDEQGRPLHILHRAISPVTLRVARTGRVKLCDFGAAFSELWGRVPTPPHVLRGNFAYAAPELLVSVSEKGRAGLLASREVDHRADLFSLGLVLLEMIAGHHPLDPPDALAPRVSRRALRLVSGVRTEHSSWTSLEVLADRLLRLGPEEIEHLAHPAPVALRRVVHRALRHTPEERYPSAAAMREDILACFPSAQRPFGAPEAAAELADILRAASSLKRRDAHPVELGVLPWPKAVSTQASPERRRR